MLGSNLRIWPKRISWLRYKESAESVYKIEYEISWMFRRTRCIHFLGSTSHLSISDRKIAKPPLLSQPSLILPINIHLHFPYAKWSRFSRSSIYNLFSRLIASPELLRKLGMSICRPVRKQVWPRLCHFGPPLFIMARQSGVGNDQENCQRCLAANRAFVLVPCLGVR